MRKAILLVVATLVSVGCGSSAAPKTYSFAGNWLPDGDLGGNISKPLRPANR
jgi:hypothetical protein